MAHIGNLLPKETSRWHPLFYLAPGIYMMCRRIGSNIATALLCIHSFRPLLAHTFTETERMAQTDPETLITTADKLRYYRHVRGLEQQEVAVYIGLHRGTYAGYETPGVRDYYPLDKLCSLAELFDVPLDYLWTITTGSSIKGRGRRSGHFGRAWDFPEGNLLTNSMCG